MVSVPSVRWRNEVARAPSGPAVSAGSQPVLEGARVTLRPFRLDDAPVVERLAGAREIADTTLSIPHPYPSGAAEEWIASHRSAWEAGTEVHYAITSDTDEVLGAMSLGAIAREQQWAEIGYWVGVPHWNKGYCTEGGRLLLRLAFGDLGLHRIFARHLVRNPASGRVMEKLGMRREGLHRDAVKKWGKFEDVVSYAVLVSEWENGGVDASGSS